MKISKIKALGVCLALSLGGAAWASVPKCNIKCNLEQTEAAKDQKEVAADAQDATTDAADVKDEVADNAEKVVDAVKS